MRGRNLTIAIEHEKVHIIPYLLLEIRGTKTIIILLSIFLPLTLIIVGMTFSNTSLMFLFLFFEILFFFIMLFALQRETRSKTDHISLFQKFYYDIKSYQEIRVDFTETYYLKPKHKLFPLIMEKI